MHKQTTITITREDFFQMLAEKGMKVPNTQYLTVLGGDKDYSTSIDFPIIIKWEEKASVPYTRNHKFPKFQDLEICNLAVPGNKIPVIKKVREYTGWSLYEAKEWAEWNFPQL